jgi:hypothetical protein
MLRLRNPPARMMMAAMPILKNDAEMVPADAPDNQLFMVAPVVTFSSQVTTNVPNLPSTEKFEPSPLRPRWQNFRKFDIDLFEMPSGDFFGKDVRH